jgi:hypothetical protein
VESDGQVVILSVAKNRVRYFDSDTVSCLANLARLSSDLKKQIDTSLAKDEFNNTLPIKRLLHFIRQEKMGSFEPEIVPAHIDDVLLVKPKQNNRRILAQAGGFFVFGLTQEIAAKNSHGIDIQRITISAAAKHAIRNDLDKLGINEKTLFPEIDRAASYLAGTLSGSSILSRIVS